MSINIKYSLGAAFLAMVIASSPAMAQNTEIVSPVTDKQASFDQDRAAILAMAGDYKVSFDINETTSWRADYEPLKGKVSHGHESIRVIKDNGDEIILQHILVTEFGGDTVIIKHWRQDWKYEPKQILVYNASNDKYAKWSFKTISDKARTGAWSQTVYQVDDSPRYSGIGRWTMVNGVTSWISDMTSRPLARRDATRDPIYDHYQGVNRHQITPSGWVHWQDNTKMKSVDGKAMPYVQEIVLNTYNKNSDYNVKAANDYWASTSEYWQAVRSEWDNAITQNQGMAIEEEANTGTVISGELLEMATQISKGVITQDAAIVKAKTLIKGAVKPVKTAAEIIP